MHGPVKELLPQRWPRRDHSVAIPARVRLDFPVRAACQRPGDRPQEPLSARDRHLPDCKSASNLDPAYCLICECYQTGNGCLPV